MRLSNRKFFRMGSSGRRPFVISASGCRMGTMNASFGVCSCRSSPRFRTTLLGNGIRIAAGTGGSSIMVLAPGRHTTLYRKMLGMGPVRGTGGCL